MGKSQSISDMEKQNNEFAKYIQIANANLVKNSAADKKEFLNSIKQYYADTPKDDQHILTQGEHKDFQQMNEFSLDSINKTIEGISKSLFGGMLPPKGSSLGEDAAQLAKDVAVLSSLEGTIVYAAKAFISNVLSAFNTQITSSFSSSNESTLLAPGVTLFAFVYGDTFHKSDYFDNALILENVVEYRVMFSKTKAEIENDMNEAAMKAHMIKEQLKTMDQQIKDYEKNLKKITKKYADYLGQGEIEKAKVLQEGKDMLENAIHDLIGSVDELNEKHEDSKVGS